MAIDTSDRYACEMLPFRGFVHLESLITLDKSECLDTYIIGLSKYNFLPFRQLCYILYIFWRAVSTLRLWLQKNQEYTMAIFKNLVSEIVGRLFFH